MPLPALRVTADRRALEIADGRPFFYLADTVWELFHRATLEDAEALLRDRAAKGFNVIQAVALAELDGLLAPNAHGHRPFAGDGLDPAYPNEPYWEHVDRLVALANERGFQVALLPSWGDKWHRMSWGVGPEIFDVPRARAYAAWLARRYRDAAILWVTGGDRPLRHEGDLALMRAFAEGLREGDGDARRLITFHPPGGASSSRFVHAEPWLDFHMLQTGHDRERAIWSMVEHDRALLPARPVVNGEPAYEAHPNAFKAGDAGWLDHADVRREFWWSVCGGAAGFAYGCHAIWQMWEPGRAPVNGPRASWRESLALPGASQVGHGRRLVESLPGRRIPASELLAGTQGAGQALPRACRAEDGAWLLAYLPEGQNARVDLRPLAGERLRARWFDPRAGTFTDAISLERGAPPEPLRPPFSSAGRDWVLLIETEPLPA
jgi:hypothetical protein